MAHPIGDKVFLQCNVVRKITVEAPLKAGGSQITIGNLPEEANGDYEIEIEGVVDLPLMVQEMVKAALEAKGVALDDKPRIVTT